MNVTQDLDIWTLILNASLVVKVVMFLLLAVSFMSWMFIFQKWFSIRRANAQTDKFEREFWSGNDLNSLYQLVAIRETKPQTLEAAQTLLFIPDLFNYLFTGERKSEFSIATTSQMYDPQRREWATGKPSRGPNGPWPPVCWWA